MLKWDDLIICLAKIFFLWGGIKKRFTHSSTARCEKRLLMPSLDVSGRVFFRYWLSKRFRRYLCSSPNIFCAQTRPVEAVGGQLWRRMRIIVILRNISPARDGQKLLSRRRANII